MPQFFTGRVFEVASRYNGPNWAEINAIWRDRADRVAWQEDQPKVQQLLGQLQQSVTQAREELQAAIESGNEKSAMRAREKLNQAQASFLDRSMMIAAQLSTSPNRYAAQAGAQLQQFTAQLTERALGAQKLQQEKQAQQWARESDRLRMDLENRRFENQKDYQQESLGLERERTQIQREGLGEERAAREAAGQREEARIGLERERLDLAKGQAEAEQQRLDRKQVMEAAELMGELRAAGMNDEAIGKIVSQASGGALDLKELEGRAERVRAQDEFELQQIEEDMKVLEAAGEDTSELMKQKERLQNLRVKDALRRQQRRSQGRPAAQGLAETLFNILSTGSSRGFEPAEEEAARLRELGIGQGK